MVALEREQILQSMGNPATTSTTFSPRHSLDSCLRKPQYCKLQIGSLPNGNRKKGILKKSASLTTSPDPQEDLHSLDPDRNFIGTLFGVKNAKFFTTSPQTPKSVGFSSESIEKICHFMKTDPPLAIGFVECISLKDFTVPSVRDQAVSISSTLLIPDFWKIGGMSLIQHTQRAFCVILDGISLHQNKLTIGVLTRNIAWGKSVMIRLTWNQWKDWRDVEAKFSATVSTDAMTYPFSKGVDRFTLQIDLDQEIDGEWANLEFAICYRVADQEHWDNNSTLNHKV
jgi:hypothetical protein